MSSSRSPSQRTSSRRVRIAELSAIHPAALASVIGGLITPRTTLDPVLSQGMQQLSQAVVSVGQSLAAAKQASSQKMMQMMQQMMQSRGGGGGKGGR